MTDRRQRVADLVGDRGREPAHGGQLELAGAFLHLVQILHQQHAGAGALVGVGQKMPHTHPVFGIGRADLDIALAVGRVAGLSQALEGIGGHGAIDHLLRDGVHGPHPSVGIEHDHALGDLGDHQPVDRHLGTKIGAPAPGERLLGGQPRAQEADHRRQGNPGQADQPGRHGTPPTGER